MKGKYGFKKIGKDWRFKIGGTSGEPFGICLRHFKGKGFRLTINFNKSFLIKIFGFNQYMKDFGGL